MIKHHLVPQQGKLSESEKEKVLQKYHASVQDLPKIFKSDPSLSHLSVKVGDIIKIERQSKTMGKASYFRVVMDG